jgi:NAD(P)-dependent dehydrogenase (short-subunit alcohol dehydrogenase family)
MDVKNRTAIITGAGGGIVRETSLRLSREGCRMVLVSRTGSELDQVGTDPGSVRSRQGARCKGERDLSGDDRHQTTVYNEVSIMIQGSHPVCLSRLFQDQNIIHERNCFSQTFIR